MMRIISAHSPAWTDAANTTLDVMVKFEELPEELLFTAHSNDTEPHGRDLFNRASSGEFGHPREYVERPVVTPPPLSTEQARLQRNFLLNACDWTQLGDVEEAVRNAWKPYRQLLRDITSQSGFPSQILWPTPPVGP